MIRYLGEKSWHHFIAFGNEYKTRDGRTWYKRYQASERWYRVDHCHAISDLALMFAKMKAEEKGA